MTTWNDVWDRWLSIIGRSTPPPVAFHSEPWPTVQPLAPPTAPETAIDHTQHGCCEAHILYGKPGSEVPTGLINAPVISTAAPRRTSSRKGRRKP